MNWAIIRGHSETGVTIMRMVEALDAGPILHQVRCEIPDRATAGQLSDHLAEMGATALIEVLARIERGRLEERPQSDEAATYAPKIGADEARIEWARPATELDRWIRGCDPIPACWTLLDDLRVRLFRPRVREDVAGEPGRVLDADPREGLLVAAGAGGLEIEEVQPAGKRRMRAEEWIRGRGVTSGQAFR